jgi:hypothetical protein
MIGQNITDHLPELKSYAKEQVPILIAQVPDYVKTELPKYRQNLVNKLESDIGAYAKQTAPELGAKMDDFFKQNKDAVGQLMQNNQDPVAQAAVSAGLKNMFGDYLRSAQINKETLESKISQSLTALDSVDNRLKHLAANKGLTDNEKRARRAIAIVLLKVDENQPKLAEITDNAKQQIDATPLNGVLQWKNNDEAVFTAPGKPPVIFKRVTPVGSFSSATKPNGPSEGAKAKGTQQEKKAATASATSH